MPWPLSVSSWGRAEERETARNAEISELRTRLDTSEANAAELQDRIDGLTADLDDSGSELVATGEAVDDALAALSALEARLVDSQADLVAARESLGEAELLRAGVVDFFVTFVGSSTGSMADDRSASLRRWCRMSAWSGY